MNWKGGYLERNQRISPGNSSSPTFSPSYEPFFDAPQTLLTVRIDPESTTLLRHPRQTAPDVAYLPFMHQSPAKLPNLILRSVHTPDVTLAVPMHRHRSLEWRSTGSSRVYRRLRSRPSVELGCMGRQFIRLKINSRKGRVYYGIRWEPGKIQSCTSMAGHPHPRHNNKHTRSGKDSRRRCPRETRLESGWDVHGRHAANEVGRDASECQCRHECNYHRLLVGRRKSLRQLMEVCIGGQHVSL